MECVNNGMQYDIWENEMHQNTNNGIFSRKNEMHSNEINFKRNSRYCLVQSLVVLKNKRNKVVLERFLIARD